MLSTLSRFILVITSLAPVASIIIAIEICNSNHCFFKQHILIPLTISVIISILITGVGTLICKNILDRASNIGNPYPKSVMDYEKSDDKVIAFLLIFLLPFIRSFNPMGILQIILLVIIYLIIVIFMLMSESYQYNICAYICGYRFYTIKDKNNVRYLLVVKSSGNRSLKVNCSIQTRRISDTVYIEV